MKTKSIIFRIAARCEAAGRPNNEDNYQVADNLADNHWGFTADQEVSLSDKGALLVVCDGMGGMNAGEVASEIAVSTIKQWFAADRLTDKVMADDQSVQHYIVDAIQAADAAIKADGKQNPEHEGMGSTIVLAWLLGQKVYVGWCGDSRAYRYNPKTGLKRLSHDHSYVQELVDAGRLTEELAFDHPNSNIITRSLGDPRGKAQPDTKVYDLSNEDIILLCSDGLCGCMRDNEIEDVIRNNQTSMQGLRDALWAADEAAGWHDNVTITLAQVISGAVASPDVVGVPSLTNSKAELQRKNRQLKLIVSFLALIILIIVAFFSYRILIGYLRDSEPTEQTGEDLEGQSEGTEVSEILGEEAPEEVVFDEGNEETGGNNGDKGENKSGNNKNLQPPRKPVIPAQEGNITPLQVGEKQETTSSPKNNAERQFPRYVGNTGEGGSTGDKDKTANDKSSTDTHKQTGETPKE